MSLSPLQMFSSLKGYIIALSQVWWIFALSRHPSANHNLLMLALGPAVADTWYDGLMISLVLGLVHLGIMSAATAHTYWYLVHLGIMSAATAHTYW